MRIAIDRITAPLTAWIPDISAVPPRRQVTIGVIASLVLHFLAFLIMALLAGVLPKPADVAVARPQPEALELEIMRPEEPKIVASPAAQEKAFIDSRGLAASQPGAQPVFESDKDMTAASEKPATGELPLPSQEGKGRFANVFETQRSAVGAVKEPPGPAIEIVPPPSAAQPPIPPSRAAVPPAVPPAPAAMLPPLTSDKPDAAEVARQTLEKLREVERKADRELALLAQPLPSVPAPETKPPPEAKPLPETKPPSETKPPPAVPEPLVLPGVPVRPTPQQLAKLTTPSPLLQPPGKPGYQPEMEKSRVEGRITNRGKNAVNAVATPLGKYKRQVYDAIGSRWQYYVKDQADMLALGSAKVSFAVTSAGRVQDIHVVANNSNASFAEVCERAIRDAELSRPPASLLEEMRDGRLEYTITFTLYSFRE